MQGAGMEVKKNGEKTRTLTGKWDSLTAPNKNVLNSKTVCHMMWKLLYIDSSRYII